MGLVVSVLNFKHGFKNTRFRNSRRIFKVNVSENEASYEQILFHVPYFFYRVISLPFRWIACAQIHRKRSIKLFYMSFRF